MRQAETLTPAQEQKLISYIKERRYTYMIGMIGAFAYTILAAPLAIVDVLRLFDGRTSHYAALAGESMQLLASFFRHQPDGAFFITWLAVVVFGLVQFFRGIGVTFGKGSDLDCILKKNYTCEFRTCGGKSEDRQKHPYYLYDLRENAFICPDFLEWRNALRGSRMLCITLDNGKGYAYSLPDEEEAF